MDVKLDFVPPTLINFVARQLIGNGHKLYQKAVGSVATSDEDYRQALQGPLYARICEGLGSGNKLKTALVASNDEKQKALLCEGHRDSDPLTAEIRPLTEIVEEETEQNLLGSSMNQMIQTTEHVSKDDSFISPEVDQALRVLDRAIAVLRERGFSDCNRSDCFSINQEIPHSKAVGDSCSIRNKDTAKNSTSLGIKPSNGGQVSSNAEGSRKKTGKGETREDCYEDPRDFTLSQEMILASDEKLTTEEDALTMTQPSVSESMRKVCDEDSVKVNGFHRTGRKPKSTSNRSNKKKQWLCCLTCSEAEKTVR